MAGKSLLKQGTAALSDVAQGRNVKEALKHRAIEGLQHVGKKAKKELVSALASEPIDHPRQTQPRKRKKRAKRAGKQSGGFFV